MKLNEKDDKCLFLENHKFQDDNFLYQTKPDIKNPFPIIVIAIVE